MLIVTGRLNSLTTRFHTSMQITANLCVSDVFWKWSKGNLMKRERELDGAIWEWFNDTPSCSGYYIAVIFSNTVLSFLVSGFEYPL